MTGMTSYTNIMTGITKCKFKILKAIYHLELGDELSVSSTPLVSLKQVSLALQDPILPVQSDRPATVEIRRIIVKIYNIYIFIVLLFYNFID